MKKILLVDDEQRRAARRDGGDAGWAFAHAADGYEGLAAVEREQPDLIMDVMMPKMDGFTTCRRMRERGHLSHHLPVGEGDIVDKGVGFQAGGDDYMVKVRPARAAHAHRGAPAPRADGGRPARAARGHPARGRSCSTRAVPRHEGRRALGTTPHEFIFFARLEPASCRRSSSWKPPGARSSSAKSSTVFIEAAREGGGRRVRPRIIQTVWGIGYRSSPTARTHHLPPPCRRSAR